MKKKTKEDIAKSEKDVAVDDALAELQSKYGSDVVMLDDENAGLGVEAIPTGSFGLDDVFGCGGMPKGRIIELFGQESSGKSTLAHFLIAQVQKAGGRAALIDAEFSYDSRYTSSIGVDTSKLLVSQPLHLEAAMDVLKTLVETNSFGIIVIDSVAAMAPREEIEEEDFLKNTMALQARKLSQALRTLSGSIARSNTIVIFINQVREKVGVFYGKKETTPGGKALKFYSSVRLEVSRGEKIVDKDGKQIGNFLKITGVKNKVGFPFLQTSVELFYGKGLDLYGDALDYATDKTIIHKLGNTYSYKDEKLGTSRDTAKKYLTEHEEMYKAVVEDIKKLSTATPVDK